MSGTSILRGRDTETFLAISLTGSTGRPLTAVEFKARTIRFTGSLGASVTIRLPLSSTEDVGRTYCIENLTSGGYTITVAPITGAGVDIAPGVAITCYYDGSAMIGQGASVATGISASVSGISTLYPLVVTDPVIGDAVTFGGSTFVNTPAGTATMAIGSAVTAGTVGAVLFIGTGPVLAQDPTQLFWDNPNNRLGIGTNAPNAPLHVLNDSATILATFKGAGAFSSVFFQLGDGSQTAAVRVYPGVNASGGGTLIGNGGVILRGHYWTGAASLPADGWVRLDMAAVTPRYHLAFGCGSTENLWMRQDGQITIGATVPTNSGAITQSIVLGGTVFLNGLTTINDTVNIILGTGTGTKWGTAANQLQGWYGATPVAQQAAPTGTDAQKIAGLITALQAYGLLGA